MGCCFSGEEEYRVISSLDEFYEESNETFPNECYESIEIKEYPKRDINEYKG